MKKKNGFTLIELLAVIVILAIIALIALPIVLNIINNSRKSSTKESVENYLRAVEQTVAQKLLDNTNIDYDGVYSISDNGKTLSKNEIILKPLYKGKGIESGTLTIKKGIVTEITRGKIGDWYAVIKKGRVELVNDLPVIRINLFDKSNMESGTINATNGTLENNNNSSRSINHISVEPNKTYIWSGFEGNIRTHYYDENKNWISSNVQTVGGSFTVPSNAYYIKYSKGTKVAVMQTYDIYLEESTVATSLE